jgi:hypothetical protein
VVRPGVAATVNLGVYIFTLVFHGIIFFLYFSFSYYQPLKSRGSVPMFAIVAHFVYSLTQFPEFLDLEWKNYFMCFSVMINYSLLQSSYILIPLTFFRYLIIVNLNKEKHYYYHVLQGQEEIQISKFFKLLDFFTSTSISLFFVGFYFFCSLTVYLYISANDNWRCTERVFTSVVMIFTISNLTILGTILLLQFYDVIVNIRSWLRCHIKDLFIKKDPFLFRSELISLYLFIPAYSVNFFYMYDEHPEIYSYVNIFLMYWLYTIQVLFILFITIVKKMLKCCRKKSKVSKDDIEWVMDIPELKEMVIHINSL